jgi:tetratricopeptide (TPR) repeat protein
MNTVQAGATATHRVRTGRPRLLIPVVVVVVFSAVLPVHLSSRAGFPSNEDCLTLADSAPLPSSRSVGLLERCSAIYPADVELLGDLAAAYEIAGADAKARIAYERALAIDPDYADLRVRFARFLLRHGDPAAAASHAEAALKVQPNRLAIVDLLRAAHAAVPTAH